MKRMLPPIRAALGGRPLLWFALLACVSGGAVHAQTSREVPEGIPGGKAIFTPWLRTDVDADDNIFRNSVDQGPVNDVITTVQAGVGMFVPIRMSTLYLEYEGSQFFYQDTDFDNSTTHTFTTVFDMNFSSNNTLTLGGERISGVTQRQTINDTGDPFRQGIPYDETDLTVEWSRMVQGKPSYRATLGHSDRKYRNQEPIPWLSYDGWDVQYEWRQPFYRRGDLTALYEGNRYDQFLSGAFLLTQPDPRRREQYDGVEFGFRGFIGRRQPLTLSVGYGQFGYRDVADPFVVDPNVPFQQPKDYKGLVGQFNWRLPVGGVTRLDVSARRRPLRSNFNTYYLVNEARISFERSLRDISRYGFVVLYGSNRYGDLTVYTANGFTSSSCTDVLRQDRRKQINGFWEWLIQPRMRLRLTAGHNRRDSNCDNAEYVSNGVGLSFRLGWFD